MQHARTAVVLAAMLTALMVACGRTEIVVITATPSPSPTPTQTYNQWLGEQVAATVCSDPEATVPDYWNENRNPPYSADFYCRRPDRAAPTLTPDPVATWVAAAVAANPTPTRRPTATLRPTRVPISTPTPTPLPTRTRAWPTPTPRPPPEYLLAELNWMMEIDTAVCKSSGGTNRAERLRTEAGESTPVSGWGEYNGTMWYWDHHCDIARNATIRGKVDSAEYPGHLEVSGFSDNWESYKEAMSAILFNEDGTWESYIDCVYDGGTFIVEDVHLTPETEGYWTIEWSCRTPTRPTPTPRTPPPTPTMQQLTAWDSRTAEAKRKCDQAGGEFLISNIREKDGGEWAWNYKCTQQPRTQDSQPQEKLDITKELIRCGTSLGTLTKAVSPETYLASVAGCMAPHLLEALSEMFLSDSILVDDGGTNPHLRAEFDHTVVVPAGGERRVNARAEGYGYLNYKFVSVKDTYSKELLELRFKVYSNGEIIRSTATAGESGSFVVHEGETLTLEFDNSSSLITGKRVWFSWHWSESPDYKYRCQFSPTLTQ